MSDPMSRQSDAKTILVLGAADPVGAEICRIGRAVGHTMIGCLIGGAASTPDEPWVQGVDWLDGGPEAPEAWRSEARRADAVVWNWSDTAALSEARDACSDHGGRLVMLAEHPRVSDFLRMEEHGVLLVSPPLFIEEAGGVDNMDMAAVAVDRRSTGITETGEGDEGVGDEESGPQPFEVLAIAALRAAVEADHAGELGPERVTKLGRAMFIQ